MALEATSLTSVLIFFCVLSVFLHYCFYFMHQTHPNLGVLQHVSEPNGPRRPILKSESDKMFGSANAIVSSTEDYYELLKQYNNLTIALHKQIRKDIEEYSARTSFIATRMSTQSEQ